jgi:tetratricopeptide (TPR) repeat protein
VGGSFAVSRKGDLVRLNVSVGVLGEGLEFAGSQTEDALLTRLFDLEKRIVFGVLDDLGVRPTRAEREAIDEVPTRNLQAFLAYARGLSAERAGNYLQAAQAFEQAVQIDPGFSQAAEQQEAAQGLGEAGGALGKAVAAETGLSFAQASPVDLQRTRLGQLGSGHLQPGGDREAGEEAATSAVPVNPRIPLPADPPPSSSGGGN